MYTKTEIQKYFAPLFSMNVNGPVAYSTKKMRMKTPIASLNIILNISPLPFVSGYKGDRQTPLIATATIMEAMAPSTWAFTQIQRRAQEEGASLFMVMPQLTAGFKLAPVCLAHIGMAIKMPTKKAKSTPVKCLEQVDEQMNINMANTSSQKMLFSRLSLIQPAMRISSFTLRRPECSLECSLAQQ